MNLIDFVLLAQATTPAPGAPPSGAQMINSLMFPIALIVIFYFLLIRPQQKRQKEHAKLVASIQSGDAVITNAGIHGVITNVKEKTVVVRVADNVKIEFDRAAIATVTRDGGAEKAA
jgi:preprotein translocase subunit YajC